MKKLLFDADMLIYRMTSACQENSPFNKEIVIKACPIETWACIELRVKQCVDLAMTHFDEKVEIVMVLSPRHKTFRYDVDANYKSNRKGVVKPILLADMYDKICKEYTTEIWDNLEADDVLGILADEENTIIVSDDKDLKQIETWHMKVSAPEEVEYANKGVEFFLQQCISGDPVDGYYGVPGMGKAKAETHLRKYGYAWASVVKAYEDAMSPKSHKGVKLESVNLGLTEEDALVTARLAYILKEREDYNEEESTVNLWSPTDRAWGIQG